MAYRGYKFLLDTIIFLIITDVVLTILIEGYEDLIPPLLHGSILAFLVISLIVVSIMKRKNVKRKD